MHTTNYSLDPRSRSPLFRQLEDQILFAISVGELRPGDTLPSIRDLERQLDLNRNTARQAYVNLEAKGAIILRRGQLAEVAEPPPPGAGELPEDLVDDADRFAQELITRCEALGLDASTFSDFLSDRARDHDTLYPRCAFAECSDEMAVSIARHLSAAFGRSVAALNLRDPASVRDLPGSVRVILTPFWHLAEAESLVSETTMRLVTLELRLSADSISQLQKLGGQRVLVVVRDAESTPGYRRLIRRYMKKGRVDGRELEQIHASPELLEKYDCIVHTSPCSMAIEELFSSREVVELRFEPADDALDEVTQTVFPQLERKRLTASQELVEAE